MLYILSAILLWSSLGLVIRASSVPVPTLIFFSNLVASLLLGAFALSPSRRHELQKIKAQGRGALPLLALGPIALVNTFSFFFSYRTTTIANAVLTHYTAPLFVALLAPVFLKERLTRKMLLAVLIGSLGLWIMLGISGSAFVGLLLAGDKNTAGIMAGLFSGLSYAVLIIVFRSVALAYSSLVMTLFQNCMVCLLLAPFVAWSSVTPAEAALLLLTGVVHSTIAPLLYFKGLSQVTSNRAAILGYLEPLCAILLGLLFLGEAVNAQSILGGAMILLSGYLTIRDA